jgi:tRNA (cmo5U34)-methyltransferase
MTDTIAAFNAHAVDYDAARRRLVPPFDALYSGAVDALGLAGSPVEKILDLGAGTGLLSSRIREARPEAQLTLLDGARSMLDEARQRLGSANAIYLEADLNEPLPAGPWDAIVSALAIHHLAHQDKQRLFGRIHEQLRPGGVFVNAEHVSAPTPLLTAAYHRWHESTARAAGSSSQEWTAALERMSHDVCATVEHQLAWLTDSGFRDVDCVLKDHHFALIVARRDSPMPASRP